MKRLIAVLLLIAGMYSPVGAQTLSARAFTEEIVKATRAAAPSAVVTVTKDLEFTIRFADGRTTRTSIAGAYQSYKEDPKRLQSLIDVQILGLTDTRLSSSRMQEKLSPRAFTLEIADALRKGLPSVTVTVERELEIELRYSDGQNLVADLRKSFEVYSKEPQCLESLIKLHIERFATDEWAKAQVKLDHSKIVPVVKNRTWLADTERRIKEAGANQTPLVEDFVDDLVVAYAEDTPQIFRYLARHEYHGRWEGLRSLAIQNLARAAPKVEIRQLNEFIAVASAGDDYTSSLLVVDPFWSSPERFKIVKGDIVVAIPTRDAILVTGTGNTRISQFREVVADLYGRGPNSVSQTLLVYRNSRFAKFTGN